MVAKSMEGDYREKHLFALRQSLVGYRFYTSLIVEVDVELEVLLPLGMRQRLANQSPIALPRGQVVALHVRGVDPGATPVGLHDPDQITLGPEEDLPPDLDHASPFAPLLDLGTRAENRPWAPHRADPDPPSWKRARTTRARVA